jgi:branched-chain amino acid aminotransferase
MICTISKNMAEERGFNDALMLDWRGQVAEATGANIFMVKDGQLITPTPDCFLDGITRRTVIELAKSLNIPVVERAILPDELSKADEVFLTGTAVEVAPVGRIGDWQFTSGKITEALIAAYAKEVGAKSSSQNA